MFKFFKEIDFEFIPSGTPQNEGIIEQVFDTACPALHIKCMCNTGCGNATNHVAHTQEQDPPSGDRP